MLQCQPADARSLACTQGRNQRRGSCARWSSVRRRWYLEPDPLVTGLTAENVVVLAGITVVATAVALLVFERRDLQA